MKYFLHQLQPLMGVHFEKKEFHLKGPTLLHSHTLTRLCLRSMGLHSPFAIFSPAAAGLPFVLQHVHSSKKGDAAFSLDRCLENWPPLQNDQDWGPCGAVANFF